MVVICPKCKIRLKVDEGKLTEKGSRFKCPKCSTVLLVKKPQLVIEKPVDKLKILVGHSNSARMHEITDILSKNGYQIITATDGIDAMVKSIKELPFLSVLEVSLPKIYGFEVCKRLKGRIETKAMKCILVSSPYDKDRYKREPESLYDADDYIEEQQISVTRDLHCWEVEFAYDVKGSNFIEDDFTVWLAFKIKAFPGMQLGLSRSFKKRSPGAFRD